jgi:thioredoxin 1
MTEVQRIDEADFGEHVLAIDLPVLVEFWKQNCAPWRILARSLDEYTREAEGIRVVAVNVEQSLRVAVMYDVLSVPTLKLLSAADSKVLYWSANQLVLEERTCRLRGG